MCDFSSDIDESVIIQLITNYQTKTINNVKYTYLGKGGEGIVYGCDDKVIKIYVKVDMNKIVKEFYIFGILNELGNLNVIRMDRYYLSLTKPVIIMERMDGDLMEWCNKIIRTNTNQNETDNLWLNMIFQVTYGLMYLNKLNILHSDAKAKNILYKANTVNDDNYEYYKIGNRRYKVSTKYLFKIADFGAVQILGTSNKLSDEEIIKQLQSRQDLYELSRIIFRIIVNHSTSYGWSEINKFVSDNADFKKYYDNQKAQIDLDLAHMPKHEKDRMLLRSLIYWAVENNVIKKEDITTKHSLNLPSKNIDNILSKLIDPNVKNVFDLFESLRE